VFIEAKRIKSKEESISTEIIKPRGKWFRDHSFNGGCSTFKLRKAEVEAKKQKQKKR
jgi:hypothetical protein